MQHHRGETDNKKVFIGPRGLGAGERAYIIAEVGQAHDGSLGMAHSFIDAATEAGADAIKFQTHIAAAESTLEEPFRARFSLQDSDRYSYWQRMEFSDKQWRDLAEHARGNGIEFISSPFSSRAVELLRDLGVLAWKIGSGEALSLQLIEAIGASKGTVLLSTGMSRWEEIDRATDIIRTQGNQLVVFQCTSKYPTSLDQVGMNILDQLRKRYHCPVGLSDHSGTPFPALSAIALGCEVIEVHVTFDRRMFGPDMSSSVTFDELQLISQMRDASHTMSSNPVDKDLMATSLESMRNTFGKSVAVVENLEVGTIIQRDMLTLKKPASGIPESKIDQIIGKKLNKTVSADRLLSWMDFE